MSSGGSEYPGDQPQWFPQEYPPKGGGNLLPITAIIAIVIVVVVAFAFTIGPTWHYEDKGEDIGLVAQYWYVNTSTSLFDAGEPINQSVAFRVVPKALDPRTDRIYFASGDKVIALRPSTGRTVWYIGTPIDTVRCFQADSLITAGPIVANYGSVDNPDYAHWILYFGTESGEFYQLKEADNDVVESAGDRRSPLPMGEDVSRTTLDSKVTSIAVYADEDYGRNAKERVYVGTEEGMVYAFSAAWKDDESWFFNGSSEEWQRIYPEARPLPQDKHVMAYSPASNKILFVGGDNGLSTDWEEFVETWIFDLTSKSWRELDNMSLAPSPRKESAMVYVPSSDSALLYGGKLGNDLLDDMWTFNFSTETWSRVENSIGSPGLRGGHSMAYVNSEDAVYLFGGRFSDIDKTMRLHLSNWTWSTVYTSEDVRSRMGTSMVYDPAKGRLVIFGGDWFIDNQTKVLDISSGTWSWIDTPANLRARAWTSMAYDNATNSAILFGGEDEYEERRGQTWKLDLVSDTWEQLNTTSPPSARFSSSMVFTDNSEAFLFGGNDHEPSELWNITASEGPIMMAGLPLNEKNSPRFSQAVYSPGETRDGEFLVFNGGEYLNHIRTQDGTPIWSGDEQDYILPDGTIWVGQNWSTAPIFSQWLGIDIPPLIHLGTGNGFLHALYPDGGGEFADWTEEEDGRLNEENGIYGIQLKKASGERDTGALSTPEVFGGYIYVASDSRIVYKVQMERIGDSRAGTIKGRAATYAPVITQPQYLIGSDTIHFVDTSGRLYAVNEDMRIYYRVYVGASVTSGISIWKDEQGSNHLHRSVFVGGMNGNMYCYSSAGG